MKKLLTGLLIIGTFSAFAQSSLEITGFKLISNTSKMQVLTFQDSMEFKISKERFLSQETAIQFCKKQNSKLDTETNSLLIAMSGAANISSFLKQSITFKIGDSSGIWQWSGEKGKVTMMFDGQGVSAEEVLANDLNRVIRLSLPAICIRNL